MPELTLVPEAMAQPGRRLTFAGPNAGEDCAGCPFRALCFRLEPGRRYEVTGLREVWHPCRLHDGDRVRVAEVREVPILTSIEDRHLRGTAASWAPVACGRPQCPRYGFCHPQGLKQGARHQIVATGAAIECPAGFDLHEAQLRLM